MAGAAVPFARLPLCQDVSAAGWVIPEERGAGIAEKGVGRKMEREAGSYIRTKFHTTAINLIFCY